MALGFLKKSNKPIREDQKYDSTPVQDVYSVEIGSVYNKVETYLDKYISGSSEPKYYGEVEIHKIMDAPEEIITSEDLDNQSTQKLEVTRYYR